MALDRTLHMFAEASTGEDGATGSLAGDQIGVELRARQWYESSAGWGKVYHFRDSAVRERIAQAAERIVLNGWFGYDQGNTDRNAAETALKKVGHNVSAVHTPCEMDCSMMAFEAIKVATGIDYSGNKTTFAENDDEYFGHTYNYPKGWNFDAYLERVIPLAGFALDVYTLSNFVDDTVAEKVVRSDARLSDTPGSTNQNGYFESPYDTLAATLAESVTAFNSKYGVTGSGTYTKTYDLATLQTNLTVSVANSNSVWMESAANLVRGDIVRTRTPFDGGHIAVWI